MNDETTTIIQERIAQLPDELQQAISQTDIKGILQRISSKYNLRADQAMALEQETLFVLLGLESRMDFTANIKREMIISEAAATAITSDLDTDLFLAVRHCLCSFTLKMRCGKKIRIGTCL